MLYIGQTILGYNFQVHIYILNYSMDESMVCLGTDASYVAALS